MFDPNYDTLAAGEALSHVRVETPSTWSKMPIARATETWTDARGVRHIARTDLYAGEPEHNHHAEKSKYADERYTKSTIVEDVESSEVEGNYVATRYAESVSERTSPSSGFIWGGRWGR